jgi:hypothetical protein
VAQVAQKIYVLFLFQKVFRAQITTVLKFLSQPNDDTTHLNALISIQSQKLTKVPSLCHIIMEIEN